MMDTKDLQKHFYRIGAKFEVQPYESVQQLRHDGGWRHRIHRPILRIKANKCVLVYEASFSEQLDIRALSVPKEKDLVLLSIAYFNTRLAYLCLVHHGHLVTRELASEKPGTIAADVTLLRELIRPKVSRRKQQRRACALSFTAANKRMSMTETQYTAYIQLAEGCRHTKFMQSTDGVVAQYGHHETNTYLSALMRIAMHHKQWLRDPADWKAGSRNPKKAFQELIAHLFGRYPVPEFLATIWFRRRAHWIPCYIDVARGVHIRKADSFDFPLTKRMAHSLMTAPDRFTMEEAIRWGQVQGLGGNERFFAAICRTRMTPTDRNNPKGHVFWQSVMAWLLRHPMLATEQYAPLVDYIRRERNKDKRFSMAGRSPQVLLRSMEAWQKELNHARWGYRKAPERWTGHGLDWWYPEKDDGGHVTHWRFTEILQTARLREEGKIMRHCVSSYLWSCVRGKMAILSLERDGIPELTVEYVPETHQVGEVRGKMNRVPTAKEWAIIRRWADARRLG